MKALDRLGPKTARIQGTPDHQIALLHFLSTEFDHASTKKRPTKTPMRKSVITSARESARGMSAAAFALLLTTSLASAQEVPKMEMTTEIPKGVTTPDNIQTAEADPEMLTKEFILLNNN